MLKNKKQNKQIKIGKVRNQTKKTFFVLDEHLFIKLLLVIVISSLFLIGILSLLNKLWYSSSYSQTSVPSVSIPVIENKIPDLNLNGQTGPVPPPAIEDEEPIMCTMEYMPVCAWRFDGICTGKDDCPRQTYGNACVAGAAKAYIVSEGECK